jgi:hypothetical protein
MPEFRERMVRKALKLKKAGEASAPPWQVGDPSIKEMGKTTIQ